MGMAASQARLLTLTARLADNELRSQTINNAKMRLATQSSQASENYVNALNNATMKFSNYNADGETQIQPLTFNALTAYSSYNTQYGLSNSSGQLLVSEAEAAMFNKANGNINSYLQLHGLEYTTTYFDELGSLKNEYYPMPFDSVGVGELQSYYENYTSYQNSLELETYSSSYSAYVAADDNLSKGSKSFLEAYLMHGSSPALTQNANKSYEMALTGSDITLVNNYKNAFIGTNNSAYNLDNLKNIGFINQEDYDFLKTMYVDSIKYVSGHVSPDGNTRSGIKMSTPLDLQFVATETSKEFIIDESLHVQINDDGKVVGFVSTDTNPNRTYNIPAQNGTLTFQDFMRQLSANETDEDDSSKVALYEYELSGDGSESNPYTLSEYAIATEQADQQDVLNDMVDTIIDYLKTNANYENFAKWIVEQRANGTDLNASYGIDVTQATIINSKTLTELLDDYTSAKEAYFNSIFDESSKAIAEQDLENGYSFVNSNGETVVVTPENLTDIDFCLQYMKNRGLTQSDSFNTVVAKFLVDEMVEVNGEPKYAWVDSNDTGNTGNADAKAQWYTNLFKRMQQGYKAIENGLAASSEWLEFALESGIVVMEQVDKSFNWKGLDYKTCTRITEETDDAAVTKAEAEYNRAMNDIKAKDNVYDIQLKNIDTEHTSLQTEYDVIKGVIDKNIARTFKFNQSA